MEKENGVILQVSLNETNDVEIQINQKAGVSKLTLIGIIEQVKMNLLIESVTGSEIMPVVSEGSNYDA